jgi:hypothetical protein
MVSTVVEPRIGSIRFETQEVHFNKRFQRSLAQCTLDTAEALGLFKFKAQTRHFQIFSTETIDRSIVRHSDFSTTDAVTAAMFSASQIAETNQTSTLRVANLRPTNTDHMGVDGRDSGSNW